MHTVIKTTLIRDRDGYEVRDYGDPALASGQTILGGPPSGIHIVGKSGVNELISISTAANLRLWRKACQLVSAVEVANFMCRWGQITKWLTDDGKQPYAESFLLIEPHLRDLKSLAYFVESDDKRGFCSSLKGQFLITRANVAVDVSDSQMPLVIEAPSLLRFMLFEMWCEFGGEKSAHPGIRSCAYCNKVFSVGGRRRTNSRRADSRYCSDSCKNLASRNRTRNRDTLVAIPQR